MPVAVSKLFSGLKSGSLYQASYYCVNQMNITSDASLSQFQIPDNGGYFLKVMLHFRSRLTYNQNNELACALTKLFELKKSRVYTQFSCVCGGTSRLVPGSDYSQNFTGQTSNGLYQYMFYVIPDYALPADSVNQDILEALSSQDFNQTLMAKVVSAPSYPVLQEFESERIQVNLIPTVTLTRFVVGVDSVLIAVNLANYKGFVIIGLYNGTVNALANGEYDIAPTPQLMKQGLCGNLKAL